MTMRSLACLLCFLCGMAAAQRRSRPNAEPGSDLEILQAAVASFDGTLRVLDKKHILLEVAEGQTISIEVNKKTLFFRAAKPPAGKPPAARPPAEKPIAAREIPVGSVVTVEARKSTGQLIALRVHLHEPPPGKP